MSLRRWLILDSLRCGCEDRPNRAAHPRKDFRDKENHREQNAADNHVEIARQDGFEKKRAEAGPAHDDLDEQRAAQERADAKSEKRDERICGGAEGVAEEEFAMGNAMAEGRSKKGSIENFGDRSADVANQHWQSSQDKRNHRKGHVRGEVAELMQRREFFIADGDEASGWKPASADCQDQQAESKD